MDPEAEVLRLRGPLQLPGFAEEHTHRNRVDRKGVVTLCCEDLDAGSRVDLKTDGFVAVCEFAWRTAGAAPADRGRGMEQFLNAFIEKHHGRESPELVLMDQQYVVQCAVCAGKNCAVASCKVRRVCDVPVIKSALYKYLKDSGAKRFGRILLRYDRNVVPGWMRMEIQDRKRAQEILVYDELSRVGTRAAAREAKRQLWRLVDYFRALEACCASWIAQTRIDACKLLHVPARVVLSDRTRKDQVRVVFVPAERLAAAVLEAAPVVRFDA